MWAEQPFNVAIYYRDIDPPNWADYSHNPYQFSPKVEADVGPNQQWNLDVGLANPDEWAMVVASTGGESTKTPNIHCALAVDGVGRRRPIRGPRARSARFAIGDLASRTSPEAVRPPVGAAIPRST